jgi:hypothetical protein
MARALSCRKRKAQLPIDQTVCWRISGVVDLVMSLLKLDGSPFIRPADIKFDGMLSTCHIEREDRSRDLGKSNPHGCCPLPRILHSLFQTRRHAHLRNATML